MHDFDELKAFAEVMASGSLTRSARKLGLAKSTLSRRISHLEARLEQPLLRRQANRLLPTEAGLVFHRYCQDMLKLAESSHEALAELREDISGTVTLEVHSALARGWMGQVLDTFMARYPQVELTLRTRDEPPSSLNSHSVHVCLGPVPENGLHQEPLGSLTRGLYASPSYLSQQPLLEHPRDLADHPWIDLLSTTQDGLLLHHESQANYHFYPPRSRLRVDMTALHLDAIAHGKGIGLLPHWLADKREAHHPGELVPCLPNWQPAPLPITLLYAYGYQPRRVKALLAFLRQTMPRQWQHNEVAA
ncbi:LysR family transcriptional regulator [Halomonas sp. Mc5H-6]|uniref:LysR family transcriptional regulator n=1 Tax=Halomonas sp. Mc5H-6 TaxID=2954500 RepID=UPI002097CACC|nr:LysR family transcriptional regulator [Halomonas sp. Mc5H-6]MCO7245593.1 LysR family transcriptional regulator [Halomonas sp. Mc5H-6]